MIEPQIDQDQNSVAGEDLLEEVKRHVEREQRWRREGEPSLLRQMAAVGVMGWIVVVPTLLGVLGGRWIDHRWDSGITATGALMVLGLAFGCWSAWRWMHKS